MAISISPRLIEIIVVVILSLNRVVSMTQKFSVIGPALEVFCYMGLTTESTGQGQVLKCQINSKLLIFLFLFTKLYSFLLKYTYGLQSNFVIESDIYLMCS